jgi:hypothetical protein
MKNCLLLLLSTNHLHAQHMVAGNIADQREFSDSADGRADFADFLRTLHCPTYLLTDLIEEDFRLETIPHLIGKSHRALLQRKFDQFYRGTPFQQATLLQRQKTGRRDEVMLFSALTNPNLITPWVDILLEHKIPLAGIYSVPQISAPLVQDNPSNHLLLITWNKFAGLRETYFSSHRLHISRLTPTSNGLTFQDAVVGELGRTYQYLKSLSLLPAGQVLDVRIVGHSSDLIQLQTRLPRSADMRYDFIDLATLAKNLGIATQIHDSDANQIFLRQLAVHQPKSQYGNAAHTHYFSLWQLRRILFWASCALVAGSLLWALQAMFLQDTPDQVAVDAIKQQILGVQNETRRILQSLPKTDVPAADIKSAVTTLRTLHQRSSPPQQFLMPLSQVMNRYPKIQLDELAWQSSATEPVADHTAAEFSAQVMTFKGHLDDTSTNYRLALDYLDQFQHALEKQNYQVTVLTRPFDVSPQGSLSDLHDTDKPARGFALKLVWRPAS